MPFSQFNFEIKSCVALLNTQKKLTSESVSFICTRLPFKIRSIQVAGGGEFRKDLEQACKELNISLFVLPPNSPDLIRAVGRTALFIRYCNYLPRFYRAAMF